MSISKTFLLKINKNSKGAEGRLYRAIRLHTFYRSTASNYFFGKTKLRYKKAEESLYNMIPKIIRNRWPGYTHWWVQPIGSNKFIDLQADKNIEFLVNLEVRD